MAVKKRVQKVPLSDEGKLLYAQAITPWDEILAEVTKRRAQAINAAGLQCAKVDDKDPNDGWQLHVDIQEWQRK
ncbi:MAG: hypothetical protein GY906_38635 [bacterium]|nr:hypothetical protein [bacterium]